MSCADAWERILVPYDLHAGNRRDAFFQAREFGLVKSREWRPEDSPMVFCRQGGYRDVCVREMVILDTKSK